MVLWIGVIGYVECLFKMGDGIEELVKEFVVVVYFWLKENKFSECCIIVWIYYCDVNYLLMVNCK